MKRNNPIFRKHFLTALFCCSIAVIFHKNKLRLCLCVCVYRIRWQRENGIMNKYKRRWFPKKPICEGGARGFLTVGLQEVKPALFLLLYGSAMSLGLMFIEICMHKAILWSNRNKVPQQWANVHIKLMKKY